ncbi:MAG: hypothetical protein U0804_16970 [Gemmataceae bacterium]
MSRFLLLLLVAAPVVAAEPAPPPRLLPDESGFPAALKAALGDYFEFLGGEPGTTRGEVADAEARRFWFARVRAKRAGVYRLSYSVRVTPPKRDPDGRPASEAEYHFWIVVAECGARRIFSPQEPACTTSPTAVVGDTLVIPVHSDAGRTDYRFAPVECEELPAAGPLYDWEAADWKHRVLDEEWPAARVTAPTALDLINSWRMYDPRDNPDGTVHHLGAYLSFATLGAWNLAARLSDEPAGAPGRRSLYALLADQAGVPVRSRPFRIVPRDQPVTVLLADFRHTAHYDTGGSSGMPCWVEPGTTEVRVGEAVLVEFGYVHAPAGVAPTQGGVVEALPFRDIPHYTPR